MLNLVLVNPEGMIFFHTVAKITVVITVRTKLCSRQLLSDSVFPSILWAVALKKLFNWTK